MKTILAVLLLASASLFAQNTKQTEMTLEKDQTATGKKVFTTGVTLGPIPFSSLSSVPKQADATMIVISDGTPGTTCTGGGNGALGVYLNGHWNCSALASSLNNPVFTGTVTMPITGGGVQCLHVDNNGVVSGTGVDCGAGGGGGGGTVSQIGTPTANQAAVFTDTTHIKGQDKAVIDPRDYGVDCTDTNDSTTAWAAAVTAAGNYGKIVVPQHCLFKLTGTPGFSLYKVYGLEIEFAGRQGNGCDNQSPNPSGIDYRQSYASGNTVVSILDSQRLLFKNLTIYTNGGADNGILIDQDGSTPPITTRNDFHNVCIVNNVSSRNSSWKGISVSPTAISNVENQHFYHPDITCSNLSATTSSSNGYAILFGASANLKNEIVDDYNSHNCSQDVVSLSGGDLTFQFGLASNSYNNIGLGGFNDALYGFRSENATNAVSISNSIGPHLISHNDFAAAGGTIIDCPSGCGQLTLFNNQADSTPGNWFNVHGVPGASGPLVAFGNRNFSWNPLDWQLGAFVVTNSVTTSTNPRFFLTPLETSGAGVGGNVQSPAIDMQSLSGSGATTDDYIIQTLPSGILSNTPTSSTLALAHAQASTIAPWLATPATLSGLNLGQITNTANLTVTWRGASGATSYSYVVVAHGNTGTTAASNTTTIANGNATLTGTNFNLVIIPMVGGCTYFDVYRTASGGTPSTTGKIGTRDCFTTSHPSTVNSSSLYFSDTGLAGDGTTAPVTNTTGQLTATGGTLTVNSNLTANNVTTGNLTINGSCTGCGGGGGSGTVTSVATTTPITGGPFSTTGTIACPTCLVASSPAVGILHVAGSTQTATSSAVVDADLSGSVAVAHGGTGATTAANALIGLLPAGTRVGDMLYCKTYASSACTLWDLVPGNGTGSTGWLQETLAGAPSWTIPPGSGTVAVVGAGNLTSTALTTGGGTQLIQTPSATTTLDSSGNISVAAGGSVGSADTGTPKFTFATNLITANQKVTGTIFNASTGFAIPAATTAGHYLRNNATNFVDSAILAGDLPSLSGTYLALSGGGTMNGNILFTDNLYDIGAVSATRPRSGYFANSVNAPTINALTGFQISGAAPLGHFLSGTGTNYADNARLTDDGSTLSYTGAGGIQAASLSITSGFQIYSVHPAPAFAAVAANDGFGFSSDGNLYTSNNGGTPSQLLTAANGFSLLGSGTNTTGALVIGPGASLTPTSGTVGQIAANAFMFASTTLTSSTLPTDGQCLGRSGTTIVGFTCSGGSSGTFQTNAVNLTSSSTINFQNSNATNGLTLTFANPSAGNVKLGLTGTLTNAGLANSSTTVQGANCGLGSACNVETAASGQLAVSGGSGAALTGAASLTYSGSTLSTTAAGVVDLSAATGTSAFKVPTAATAGAANVIVYDNSAAANYHAMSGTTESIIPLISTAAPLLNGNLVSATVDVNGNMRVSDSGRSATQEVFAGTAATTANQPSYSTGSGRQLTYATAGTDNQVFVGRTGLAPQFRALVAADLPGTLSASTAITNAVLTTPNIGTPSAGTLTNATGLPIGGISATGTPSNTTYLRGDGTWSAATGTNGMSGMTAAQVPIAASANTVTSSEVLAGAGAGITTGPTSSTTGDVVSFTGTGGQIADSAVLAANLVTAASNYTSGQFVKAAGNNKTTSSAAIAAADLPAALDNSTSINGTSVALSKTLVYTDSATVNKVTLTAPATSATLTIADGKTLTATNTIDISKTAGVAGAIPWYDTTTSHSATALLAANGVMIGGGTSAAPSTIAASTTTTQALFATAGAPAFRGVAAGDLPGTLSSGTAITNAALTTPAIGAATGTSLLVTGIVDGTAPITITTGTTATLGAGTYKSGYTFNQEATAATGVTYTLPATAVGLQYCVRNSIVSGTGAADTGVLTVYPPASSFIILNGVRNTIGGGGTHGVASGGAAGDSACFVAIDATDWEVYVIRGTWTAN